MRGVSLFCLLLVLVGAHAWVVEKTYLSATCNSSYLINTEVLSGHCQRIDSQYVRFTCSGSDIVAQTCYESSCTNCDTANLSRMLGGTAGSCISVNGTGYSMSFECTNQFPAVGTQDLVGELYFNNGCSGDPFIWTIVPNSGSSCGDVQAGVCQSDSSAAASENTNVYEKFYCGDYTIPTGTGSDPTNCTVDPFSCRFYWDCAENLLPCASSDYALSIGYTNCIAYEQNLNALSVAGQDWLAEVNQCMQTKLKDTITAQGATCASLRDASFAAQKSCYLENTAVCFPQEDWSAAMSIAFDAAITANGSYAALNNTGCFEEYYLAGVWLLENIYAGGYTNLLQEIAGMAGVNYSAIAIIDSSTRQYTWKVGHEVKRGFGLGSGGNANVTFTAYAHNATAAAQVAATFNARFEVQHTWTGASATQCSVENPSPCTVTAKSATYGAEPPATTTTSTTSASASTGTSASTSTSTSASPTTGVSSSSSASFLAVSTIAALSFFLLL